MTSAIYFIFLIFFKRRKKKQFDIKIDVGNFGDVEKFLQQKVKPSAGEAASIWPTTPGSGDKNVNTYTDALRRLAPK